MEKDQGDELFDKDYKEATKQIKNSFVNDKEFGDVMNNELS